MSFLSVEPQSRVVLESHSDSILAQFDTHLQAITDRYLAFFHERRQIEATYINSLRKLNRKAKIIDASSKIRAEPTNTRAAWDTVRDSLKKEANTQQAFVDILDKDVIEPLTKLKESNAETRKYLKAILTESASEYTHFAENTISKLQQAYLKKYHPRQYSHSTQGAPNNRPGGKKSDTFRRQQRVMLQTEPAQSDDEFNDGLRRAVLSLNLRRLARAENLRDGYDCLEDLVFTPTVNKVLEKYMNGMTMSSGKYHNLATSTKAVVKNALAGKDVSDMRASFRQALSFSIPPLTLYRNYSPPGAYSELIFGVPLVDLETTQDNVPKVMQMCIEEVEKRGLKTKNIYVAGEPFYEEVLQLRRGFESEKSFSFSSTDNIKYIATLLKLYLWELPEPLFMLSLQDYGIYEQDRARYAEDNFLLLRSKIHAKHPVHRASLRALLRHLSRVVSHSHKNKMTVDVLAARFAFAVSRQSEFLNDGDPPYVKELVLQDLIQNVHTLFDERPPLPPPVSSPDVPETTPAATVDSFLSPEYPGSAEVQAMSSASQHRPGLVGVIPASAQSSFSSLLSDTASESHLTPLPTPLLSPLPGLPLSQTLKEGAETTMQEQVIPKATDIKAVEILSNSTLAPPDVSAQVAPSSVAEWRLQVPSQLPLQPEALTIPQSPTESVLSSISDCPLSSATSLQTTLG